MDTPHQLHLVMRMCIGSKANFDALECMMHLSMKQLKQLASVTFQSSISQSFGYLKLEIAHRSGGRLFTPVIAPTSELDCFR